MRRLLVLVSAIAVVVASAGISVSAGGGTGVVPGMILYSGSTSPDGVPGIYIVRPASGAGRPLRGRFFHGNDAAWSPDGSKLVFERWLSPGEYDDARFGRDLVIAAADGSRARLLVAATDRLNTPEGPIWSRDGRFVYFINSGVNVPGRWFVVRAVERGRVRPSKPVQDAVPSPIGDTEAVRVSRGIAVRDRSTRKVRVLIRACDRAASYGGRPAWSPDGRWLAYVDCVRPDGKWPDFPLRPIAVIAIVRADGSSGRKIVARGFNLTPPSWR